MAKRLSFVSAALSALVLMGSGLAIAQIIVPLATESNSPPPAMSGSFIGMMLLVMCGVGLSGFNFWRATQQLRSKSGHQES